jgi:hypothetical protein
MPASGVEITSVDPLHLAVLATTPTRTTAGVNWAVTARAVARALRSIDESFVTHRGFAVNHASHDHCFNGADAVIAAREVIVLFLHLCGGPTCSPSSSRRRGSHRVPSDASLHLRGAFV